VAVFIIALVLLDKLSLRITVIQSTSVVMQSS